MRQCMLQLQLFGPSLGLLTVITGILDTPSAGPYFNFCPFAPMMTTTISIIAIIQETTALSLDFWTACSEQTNISKTTREL